jgi:hypothetical protein
MKRLLIVIPIWLGILLVACAGVEDNAAATDTSVVPAARAWVMATTNAQGVQALGLTCVDLRQAVKTENLVGTSLSDLLRLRLDSSFKADFSGLTYQLVDRDGETAVVQVNGNARLAAFGSEVAVELNEKWIMREEDGRWKWCGSSP